MEEQSPGAKEAAQQQENTADGRQPGRHDRLLAQDTVQDLLVYSCGLHVYSIGMLFLISHPVALHGPDLIFHIGAFLECQADLFWLGRIEGQRFLRAVPANLHRRRHIGLIEDLNAGRQLAFRIRSQ